MSNLLSRSSAVEPLFLYYERALGLPTQSSTIDAAGKRHEANLA